MIQQKSMAAIVSLEGLGIKTPKDLENKNIGDQPGSTNQVTFPVYAQRVGVNDKLVNFVGAPPPTLPQLLSSGKVQGIGQFVVGVPLVEKADDKHRKAVVLPYGDQLPELYGNAILTRTDLAKENPDQVKKFTGALLKGLDDAIKDPAGAAQILKKYVPTTDVTVATEELKLMTPYSQPSKDVQLGAVDPERVQKVLDILSNAKAIQPAGAVKPSDVVTVDLAPKG